MSLLSGFSIISRTSDKFEVFDDSNLRTGLDVEDLCNLIFNLLVLSRWPFYLAKTTTGHSSSVSIQYRRQKSIRISQRKVTCNSETCHQGMDKVANIHENVFNAAFRQTNLRQKWAQPCVFDY